MAGQAIRDAEKLPGAAAGLSGSALGTLSVLQSRRKRGQVPFVRSTRRAVPAKGTCPLFRDAGSFSSGDFSTSASTVALRCGQSAVPHRPKLPSGNGAPKRLDIPDSFFSSACNSSRPCQAVHLCRVQEESGHFHDWGRVAPGKRPPLAARRLPRQRSVPFLVSKEA